MQRDAIISVGSKQVGNEEEAVEVVTKGKFYKKNNCYYAIYDETEISGMEGTTTTLKIKPDEFTLIRMGSTNAKVEFKDKASDVSMYNTPYGALELVVQTNKLDINVNDNGGKISIDYNMALAGQKPLKTILNIDIKVK
ncbi:MULTISPECIES: DUF1934 domain-containing protein [Clostridium]|uniref:Putative beta-barrel protein YwiB n=2 Tax=Clostridium TaxID=1485 RepID=A0A151AP52_9CLOT|nr:MULTISPECIES: DUF1934 domain-containing protein [Clostridium]KYH29406.1 putative beta-barrel protein YwiB [Clostridium colicanis DSM 13634]MBE6044058.1 DUF1934 domain-containing protein [Clostridium thermopalmarium]PRR70812.1 putative beta-barrel protein YwiB [Clostridium thermopalmarium DSM 5974]PVZ28736.1 uncharacterized beta-barrel protein YwiB (DUF1934 family) [Clostridium thermopalmarium DSM 5974]